MLLAEEIKMNSQLRRFLYSLKLNVISINTDKMNGINLTKIKFTKRDSLLTDNHKNLESTRFVICRCMDGCLVLVQIM